MATVYAVASAKGGVGKTTTTAAIATILADFGADVVAIDADIGMANLASALGVTPGETTLHDVLAGRADPSDAVHEGPSGLRVVPGATDLDAYAAADPSELGTAVTAFDDADFVFVDAGAGLSHDASLPLGLADETLLVSTAERSALGDTEKTRQLAERIGGTVAGAAITRDSADAAADVTETLGTTVLGRIPEDDAVMRAVAASEPLPTFAPEAPSTLAYRDLTRALTGADVEGTGLEGGVVAGASGDADEESDDDDTAEANESDEAGGGDDEELNEDGKEADEDGGSNEVGGGDDETPEQSGPIGEAEAVEEPGPDEESAAVSGDDEEAGTDEEIGDDDTEEDTERVPNAEEIADADETARSSDLDTDQDDAVDGETGSGDSENAMVESEAAGNDIDDETETVGEKHVGADDLEGMIEEDLDDGERFDDGTGPAASGDDGATVDEPTTAAAETDASDGQEPVAARTGDSSGSDIDDELEGSVPFRDDDAGGITTVRSDGDAEGDEPEGEGEAETGDEPQTRDETEEAEGDSRGFFSRLLGR